MHYRTSTLHGSASLPLCGIHVTSLRILSSLHSCSIHSTQSSSYACVYRHHAAICMIAPFSMRLEECKFSMLFCNQAAQPLLSAIYTATFKMEVSVAGFESKSDALIAGCAVRLSSAGQAGDFRSLRASMHTCELTGSGSACQPPCAVPGSASHIYLTFTMLLLTGLHS